MSNKHPLEQEVLDDYKTKLSTYKEMAFDLYLLGTSEKEDKDLYEMIIKKAAGCEMMIDYLEKTNIINHEH